MIRIILKRSLRIDDGVFYDESFVTVDIEHELLESHLSSGPTPDGYDIYKLVGAEVVAAQENVE